MLRRMIKWKSSTLLMVPLIVGLIFMGAPMDPAWAKRGKGAGPGADPPAPTGNDFNNQVRALARAAGLESLRVAITVKDGVNDSWTQLLLNEGRVPLPKNLQAFLSNNRDARKIATQLGKALFWDMAIGSDGQSCASCHFHAGVDNRTKNQLNPNITRFENDWQDDVKGFHFAVDDPDFVFQEPAPAGGGWGPNSTLQAEDFPFVKYIGNGDNVDLSGNTVNPAAGNTNDVASSQGVFFTEFTSVVTANEYNPFALGSDPVEIRDKGTPIVDIIANGGANFQVGNINVRRVEPRNTPTTVNAVFNLHNFWDGRANNIFNGITPFGDTDRDAAIFVRGRGRTSKIAVQNIRLKNASLASQAVGPGLSHFEMSFGNPGDANTLNDRIWPDIGKKMVGSPFPEGGAQRARYLLESQEVHPEDSLLGALKEYHGVFQGTKGIKVTYKKLIEQAFNPNLWDSDRMIAFPGVEVLTAPSFAPFQKLGDAVIMNPAETQNLIASGVLASERVFSLMEANFSFFFGIAVMLYEAELVADQSPFDKFMEGDDDAFGVDHDDVIRGLLVFINANQLLADGIVVNPLDFPDITDANLNNLTNGKCVNCHSGPEFTNASVRNGQDGANLIEPMLMGDFLPAFYDNGFYNIGVTPTTDDRGRGGKGPLDKPLASSRQFLFQDNDINGPINFPIIGLPIMNLVVGQQFFVGDVLDSQELRTVEDDILVCIDTNLDNVCDIGDDIFLQRVAVDGAFKTPSIRNQELQGPYMHNGGFKTLLEVVEFYDRGGNFCRFNEADLDPDIQFLGLTSEEEVGLVKFMIATTDERVRTKASPFDHPELRIPNGHPGDHDSVTPDPLFTSAQQQATDAPLTLPAVGADGVLSPLEAFHVGLGLPEGFDGHNVAGPVVSDNTVGDAPKCSP